MKYMLDTNTCIYIIKKHPESVLRKFRSIQIGEICISSITLAELFFGVEKSHHPRKNLAALEEFILPLEVIHFDEQAANHYGAIRALLTKNGNLIGPLDLLIAAHAQSLGVTLITNNMKEFSRIVKLKVQDWIQLH